MDTAAIEAALLKEDKSNLAYIIGILDCHNPAHLYYESYSKAELRLVVLGLKDRWIKLSELTTYKQYFNGQ